MPIKSVCARLNDLDPVISLMRRLIFRWSCSIRFLRYLFCLITMRSSLVFLALNVSNATVLAPLLSNITTSQDHDGEWSCERSAGRLPYPLWRSVENQWFSLCCRQLGKVFPLPFDFDASFTHAPKQAH